MFNLTDRLYQPRGGKLGETIWYTGTELVELLKQWRNPFPDLADCLDKISSARIANGVQAQVKQESPLLSLPDELFVMIASYCYQYKDYLSLAETCMLAFERLAPVTAEVRCNMATAMGPVPRSCRSWNGNRVVWLGDNTAGRTWLEFKEHAKKEIHAAATRRGCLELEEDIAREMSSLLDIGCPSEDYEEDEEDSATEAPSDGNPATPTQKMHQLDSYKCESHLYCRAVPEQQECQAKLRELLTGSRFDLEKRMMVQLPVRRRYNKLYKKVQKRKSEPRSNGELWSREDEEDEEDDELHRLRKEMIAQERVDVGSLVGQARYEKCIRYRIENNRPWCRDQRDIRYRIVNLDTLEHLDSEVIEKHCPRMVEDPGFSFHLDTDFVLACQIAYSWDESCNMGYKGSDLPKARWAGHRLVYEGNGQQPLDKPTTDVSLEMLDMAVRVCIGDGFKFAGYNGVISSSEDE